jgi:hypothetical protein
MKLWVQPGPLLNQESKEEGAGVSCLRRSSGVAWLQAWWLRWERR